MTTLSQAMIFVLGLVLGVGSTILWFMGSPQKIISVSSFTSDTPSSATSTNLMTRTSGAVAVSDQAAGNSVHIDSVTVPPPGVWIAVQEISGNTLGNVLGAARARGPSSDLAIPLLRNTTPGQTYAVVLYRDDGNNEFSVATDSVYVDYDTGDRVVVLFKTK